MMRMGMGTRALCLGVLLGCGETPRATTTTDGASAAGQPTTGATGAGDDAPPMTDATDAAGGAGTAGTAPGGDAPAGDGAGDGGGGESAGGGTAGAGAMTGGDTDPAGAQEVPASLETLELVIMQAPCFGAGCHNDDQNPLDLRVDDALLSRMTARISASCGGLPVIQPGDPSQSALVKILREPCGETPRMPLGCVNDGDGSCIPPDYIAAIEQWIARGAPAE